MSCNQYYSFYWKGQIMKNHHKIIVLHDISHLKYGGGLFFFEKKDFLGKCFLGKFMGEILCGTLMIRS